MDLSALSDRAWQRGRLSVAARLRRLQGKAWVIGQCGIAAGAAWVVARELFGHSSPFFAPVAAVLCLGTSYGQRLRRVADVTIGVSKSESGSGTCLPRWSAKEGGNSPSS